MIDKKEHEILSIFQEESAEVIQAISKIFRFGYNSKHPESNQTNREHLAEEIGDLLAMVQLTIENNVVDWRDVEIAKNKKFEKLQIWSNIMS
jgi:NTP pyrophosphatase (non-canonical NTP hydrolase)